MYLKIKILPILVLTLFSCQKRDWDNPYDPDCPKEIFTPSNFTASQEGTSIKLTWSQTNNHISGFKIMRSANDGDWIDMGNQNKNITTWSDNNIEGGEKYTYKIVAVAGQNESNEKETSFTPVLPPTLTTTAASGITPTTAISGGNITSDGGSPITARGVCYGTAQNPTVAGNKTTNGTGTGSFISNITGLTPNTTYYIRAYAINSQGTAYGNLITFTTSVSNLETGTFTDNRDNHVYSWVKIGAQVWMAENLAYLPNITKRSIISETQKLYYVLDYDSTDIEAAKLTSNYNKYGALYNWLAAIDACPHGWHLSSDNEWKELEMYLGMTQQEADTIYWRGQGQGEKLKASLDWFYNSPNANSSGFTALPGGYAHTNSVQPPPPGYYGYWWTNIEYSTRYAWARELQYDVNSVFRSHFWKANGFSVRCIKD